jgi:hypothetical protein
MKAGQQIAMMRTRYFDEFQVPIQMIGVEEIV